MREQETANALDAIRTDLQGECEAVRKAAERWIACLGEVRSLARGRATVFGSVRLSAEELGALTRALIGEEQASAEALRKISELLAVAARITEAIAEYARKTVREGGPGDSDMLARLTALRNDVAGFGQERIAPLQCAAGNFRRALSEQIDPRSGVCGSGRVAELCHGMILSVRHAVESLKRNLK